MKPSAFCPVTRFAGLLMMMSIFVTAYAAETSLSSGVKIRTLHESEVFSKTCKADRDYPEMSGMTDKAVEAKLNSKFKKILTVGKKLKESDCGAEEELHYINQFELGGEKGSLLGIDFVVLLPGGSGRVVHDNRIFNLNTGDEVRLQKLFKPGAQKKLEALINEKTKDPSGTSIPGWKSDYLISPFRLEKSGFVIQLVQAREATRIELSDSQMKSFFKLPPAAN